MTGAYNGNGIVDSRDYNYWLAALGSPDESAINNAGDGLNGVDLADYEFWRARIGDTAGSGTAIGSIVPEPSRLMLAFFDAVGFLPRRWRSNRS